MKKSHAYLLAGWLALAGANAATARIPTVLVEGSVETTANELGLPGTDKGILTVRSCPTCSTQTFYFAPDRQLFVGGRSVNLAQMTEALRSAGSASVTLHYRRSDSLVTRIVLAIVPGATR